MDSPLNQPRPGKAAYFMNLLQAVASRATCPRRSVACVITDDEGRILATGYNGVPRGVTHCIDNACPGQLDASGNTGRCWAVHAEQNALLQLRGQFDRARHMYVTSLPCFPCLRMILNTPVEHITYITDYPDLDGDRALLLKEVSRDLSRELWIFQYEPETGSFHTRLQIMRGVDSRL